MAQFVVQDSLKVMTQNGECQIDLCLGDITQLRHEDKVDVIMVSSFRGSYSPSPTSVIGALQRNLGISVADLAKNKAEDLRSLYSCWWSHPLPDKMPYNRLMCFETKSGRHGRPQELIANVYRCLVPILNNEDGTVITPLLNTGDQGHSEVGMLQGMVVAAINWMKAGLPLRLLKIVLYVKLVDGKLQKETEILDGKLQKGSMRNFVAVCKKFAELKERYDSQYLVPKTFPIEYDVYLSYSEDDKGVVDSIQERLKAAKSDIRIYGSKQEIDTEAVWQQDMYQVMMRSARVVTVLSPHYLKSTACVEQYNIALCCNRRAHRDMLAPIYVDTIELMPTYMGLVQYVDCRPNDEEKIQEACKSLVGSMTTKFHLQTSVTDVAPIQYDIFLSYCHRDDKLANVIVELIQKLDPKLRLFFDMEELKTGKAWQRTLYHSIDGTRCLLALVSENYTKSPVCQEEYNLALAKDCSGDGTLRLIPLCVQDLKEVPAAFGKVQMVKATPDVFDSVSSAVCKTVVNWLTDKQVDPNVEHILKANENLTCDMRQVSEDQRRVDFIARYGTKDKNLLSEEKHFPAKLQGLLENRPSTQEAVDIVFSCAKEDWKYASFLEAVLKDAAPSLVIKGDVKSEQDRLTLMDTARCVIAFLSPSYLDSPEQVEEFHIALCRQRITPTTVLFPITVHTLPRNPTYFHLVPSPVNLSDLMWAELVHKWNVQVPNIDIPDLKKSKVPAMTLPAEVVLGLHEAAHILLSGLKAESECDQAATDSRFSRPVLHNVLKIQDEVAGGPKDQAVDLAKILFSLSLKE